MSKKHSQEPMRRREPVEAVADMPSFDGMIHPHWQAAAEAKGFTVLRRVNDRYHLHLRCHVCAGDFVCKLFVVMNNSPLCPHCRQNRRIARAAAAGLTFLRLDEGSRQYGIYLAPCGHRVRRQFELVERVARGECDVRCESCHAAHEAEEARDRGWELIGPDPDGDVSYRLYRHVDCGHEQRIARANMQSGRFNCPSCGLSWASAPSRLYVFRFIVPRIGEVVKLGFSRDPHSRLHHQLRPTRNVQSQIVRTVPMRTGHDALCEEKAIHAKVIAAFPDAVLPPQQLASWINVGSEVYRIEVEPRIHDLLDALEARCAA